MLEPGCFSWYSDWALGWTAEELWFSFWQGQEVFLGALQTGSGTEPVGIRVALSYR